MNAAGTGALCFPVLFWYLRRYRWLYLISLIFLAGFSILLVLGAAQSLMAVILFLWGFPLIYLASMTPVFFLQHGTSDGTVGFFLSRPLARQQVFDTVLLAGLIPVLLAGMVPEAVLWIWFLGPYHAYTFLRFVDSAVLTDSLLMAFWYLFLYLFSVWAVVYRSNYTRSWLLTAAVLRSLPLTAATAGWAVVLGASVWVFSPVFFDTHHGFANGLAVLEPWPALFILILAVACYLAGQRQFERLDF